MRNVRHGSVAIHADPCFLDNVTEDAIVMRPKRLTIVPKWEQQLCSHPKAILKQPVSGMCAIKINEIEAKMSETQRADLVRWALRECEIQKSLQNPRGFARKYSRWVCLIQIRPTLGVLLVSLQIPKNHSKPVLERNMRTADLAGS